MSKSLKIPKFSDSGRLKNPDSSLSSRLWVTFSLIHLFPNFLELYINITENIRRYNKDIKMGNKGCITSKRVSARPPVYFTPCRPATRHVPELKGKRHTDRQKLWSNRGPTPLTNRDWSCSRAIRTSQTLLTFHLLVKAWEFTAKPVSCGENYFSGRTCLHKRKIPGALWTARRPAQPRSC